MIFPLAFQATAPAKWFGPAIATFQVQFDGNPYDPAQNDVRVRFTGPQGEPIERLAYFDRGAWRAILVAGQPGKYKATLVRNGKPQIEETAEPVIELNQPLKLGYLRPDPTEKNRFRRDTGEPYYPLGFNLGWQNAKFLPMKEQLVKMGKSGVDWTRIWSSSWDSKNPWWPQGDETTPKDELWPVALDNWGTLVSACEESGVNFQMVLFNHGSFSSKVNPNWPDHPWNAAKGGFLKDGASFFTDPEAKRRTKMWLRYAVARWASSPRLMAWELFNEVEWTDARYADRWPDIASWHREMADYLREIDPYHHMVTTSSELGQPGLWAAMDYVQPHTYPGSVLDAIAGADLPKEKPVFFGEFGPSELDPKTISEVVRDGIYGAALANQAGSGMFWYWDWVENNDLYPVFAAARRVIDATGLVDHPHARPVKLRIQTPGSADLSFAPGSGWGATKVSRLRVPEDLTPSNLANLSTYFQGEANRKLMPEPLTLTLNAREAGKLFVHVAEAAKGGGKIHLLVNGREVATKTYPSSAAESKQDDTLEAPFPAGEATLQIKSDGADWVRVDRITLTKAGAQASVMALADPDWTLLRIKRAKGVTSPVSVTLAALPLTDGSYEATRFDPITGATSTKTVEVKASRLEGWNLETDDEVVLIRKKG